MKKHIPFITGSLLLCFVFLAVHLNTHKQVCPDGHENYSEVLSHVFSSSTVTAIAEHASDILIYDEAGNFIQGLNHFNRWADIDKGQTVSFKNVSGTYNASFIIGSKSYFIPKGQTITVKL